MQIGFQINPRPQLDPSALELLRGIPTPILSDNMARLFAVGPEISRREWLVLIGMLVLIMLGTINIRMAEMRERRQGILPLVDPNARSRK